MNLIELLCDLGGKAWRNCVSDMVGHSPGRGNHNLSEVGNTLYCCILNLMKFVPEVFFDFVHIAPQIHSIRFDISDFLLVSLLFIFIAINILSQVSVFWSFDNYRGNFLWCFYFFHLLLKSLLNNLRNWHVIYFRRGLYLSSSDQCLIWCNSSMSSGGSSSLTLHLIILLYIQCIYLLPELLITRAGIRLC